MDGKQLKGCHTWHNAVQPNNNKKKPFIIPKLLYLMDFPLLCVASTQVKKYLVQYNTCNFN